MVEIAVVGAGIGGLAAAAALLADGRDVHVYEQASRFARVGAGIQMSPNAVKVLRGLGVEPRVRAIAFQPYASLSRAWDTGQVTNELLIADSMERRYGAPYLYLHRADLHGALLEAVPADRIHRGCKLVDLSQSEKAVTLRFADGDQVRAAAVIGADGVHSVVREILLGPEAPRFTGRVAYRTTFPASRLRGHVGEKTKWWGPDRHIVIYYVTSNRDELYFVTSQPEPAEWMTAESWSAKGDVAQLRESFKGFHQEVQYVLEACPEVHKWALLERDPLPRWGEGRIVLLGDACHPMTPYMAQGAASALEDAAVLARCVAAHAGDFDAAFAHYAALRRGRASEIQQTSSKNTWMRQETDADWVYGYDAWSIPLTES